MINKKENKSEWINTVLKKGTLADKLAAHTLLIHESKSWSSLNALIEKVDTKKCRRQCMMAMVTVKDLFLESLNISRRDNQLKTDEDRQKARFYYTRFVDQLNIVARDNVEETRRKAIWVLSELLNKHAENKEYILEKLVDKLGDNVPKLATTAGHFVEKAVNSEKQEIREKAIKFIQRFLTRPDQKPQARYYATALLSRIKLVKSRHEMANNLMNIYLDLYTTLTKDKKIESRMMNTILVGIHRAYPYSKLSNDVFEQHLQTLYSLVHQVNFRMSVVAMVLIKDIVTKRSLSLKMPVEDRFYNLVFGQLIRPELHTCSRQEAFASLLLSVLNDDPVLERKEAFVKRILQVAVNSRTELSKLLLETITKIVGFNTNLRVAAQKDDSDDDDDESGSSVNGDNAPGWIHRRKKSSNHSDPLARNPRGAKPENLNELYILRQHFDPDVARLAKTIIGEAN